VVTWREGDRFMTPERSVRPGCRFNGGLSPSHRRLFAVNYAFTPWQFHHFQVFSRLITRIQPHPLIIGCPGRGLWPRQFGVAKASLKPSPIVQIDPKSPKWGTRRGKHHVTSVAAKASLLRCVAVGYSRLSEYISVRWASICTICQRRSVESRLDIRAL
jgi:hypothetical protein